ncbi:MAG: TIM44-like domain-containing protein [Solirubrobacterales bacterium]|nr:TIM44-like domain-containing protein [Solirubrobacterales bacterium]
MTRRRRRIAIAAIIMLAGLLILAPPALAAAGGGSAGFGGGGGEGGGGGGGGGAALYIIFQILIRVAIIGHGIGALVLLGLFVIALVFRALLLRTNAAWSAQHGSGRSSRRRTARRERRVELAAAEAADEDPAFAPDAVKPAAARLFTEIQAAWDAAERHRLAQLVAPGLLAEWERRLDDFDRRGWRNHVQPLGAPLVEYIGLNRTGDRHDDRVVVRIEARVRDYVEDPYGNHIKRTGRLGETTSLREFWTLGRRNGRWVLLSIEQGAEGTHALDGQIVPTAWSDERAMRDEALVEGAVADAVPRGTRVAEIADLEYEGAARAAALDLSLADGRFSPDVLEVAALRAVAAWARAVDGDDTALRAIAHPDAVRELLHPGDPTGKTRLVVRGPTVKQIRIAAVDAAAEPPTMTIDVGLAGRRYIEDRDTTAVIAGSPTRAISFNERWMFALDGDSRQPWRIASVGVPISGS